METNEQQISRNIKACRSRIGKSQEEIAKELNITKVTYSNIENNPLNYSVNKLNAIAKKQYNILQDSKGIRKIEMIDNTINTKLLS